MLHDKLFDIRKELGFTPSKADPDVWMRLAKDGTCHKYIAVYVDELAIAARDPKEICDTLQEKFKLKPKGTGPSSYLIKSMPTLYGVDLEMCE